MRNNLFNIILTLLVVAAFAFVSAPWFAFRALKSAADYQDVAAIAELVDFPATRLALTRQLEAKAAPAPASAEPPSLWRDPLSVFRRAIQPLAPPEPAVDKYLTVEGLSALTRGYAPGAAPSASLGPQPLGARVKAALLGPYPAIAYWDAGRARIAVKRPGDRGKQTIFTWRRRGWLDWKLVAITLPPGEG